LYFCVRQNYKKQRLMKKILLMSDTHGLVDDFMLKYVKQADEVWHAGDIGTVAVTDEIKKYKPVRAVYGNIDGTELRKEFPEVQRFIVEGVSVLLIHIGGYPNRYMQIVRKILALNPPKLFISGHSHILKVMYDKKYKLLHINPGAAGKKGFHKQRTMVRFVLDKGDIRDLEVIELKAK